MIYDTSGSRDPSRRRRIAARLRNALAPDVARSGTATVRDGFSTRTATSSTAMAFSGRRRCPTVASTVSSRRTNWCASRRVTISATRAASATGRRSSSSAPTTASAAKRRARTPSSNPARRPRRWPSRPGTPTCWSSRCWNRGEVVTVPRTAAGRPHRAQVLLAGVANPQHLVADGDRLLLSEFSGGRVLAVGRS